LFLAGETPGKSNRLALVKRAWQTKSATFNQKAIMRETPCAASSFGNQMGGSGQICGARHLCRFNPALPMNFAAAEACASQAN
jgi:hypothetical protein